MNFKFISPFGVIFDFFKGIDRKSVYPMVRKEATSLTFFKKMLLGKVKVVKGDVLVFHHVWYDNYYHWTTECLTRLVKSLPIRKDTTVALPPHLTHFHTATISAFDLTNVIHLNSNYIYLIKGEIICPSFVSETFGHHQPEPLLKLSQLLREKIFGNNITQASAQAKKRLYLSRGKTNKRICVNEDDVTRLLTRYGFEIANTDNLTYRGQIELFSTAQVVIGIHGSSFVNCMYMPHGSHIIDMMEKSHNDLCYKNMADIFGIHYHFLLQEGIGPKENFRNNNLTVNITELEKFLSAHDRRFSHGY